MESWWLLNGGIGRGLGRLELELAEALGSPDPEDPGFPIPRISGFLAAQAVLDRLVAPGSPPE